MGSGVQSIYYKWDSNSYQKYTGGIQAPEGVHTLWYYAIDNAGNTEAEKQFVVKVNTTPPAPATAPIVSTPTVSIPVIYSPIINPRVLGETTTRPLISSLKLVNSAYTYKLNSKTITIRPFGTAYKGAIWARSVDFGTSGKIYVFINSGAHKNGQVMVYSANGKLLKAYKPYGGFATNGLNATMVVESNNKVYLAVGTTKAGTTVKSYQVTAKGLTSLNTLTASAKAGNILVGFQKLYKDQYGLVTKKYGDPKTLKVWKLNLTTNKFVEDKKISKTKIKI